MRRVVFTGDALRPAPDGTAHQRRNISWARALLARRLERLTGAGILELNSPEGPLDREAWLAQFALPAAPSWHMARPELAGDPREILVVGFELPPNSKAAFDAAGIRWVDFEIHPARYLDDLLFAVSACRELRAPAGVGEESLRLRAAAAAGLPPAVPAGSAVVFGQTAGDRSLLKDGRLLRLEDFRDEIERLKARYARVFFKPHPLAAGGPTAAELGLEETRANCYDLLAQEAPFDCYGVSSSVLYEAPHFGKPAFFWGVKREWGGAVPAARFVTEDFWAGLLGPELARRPPEPLWLPERHSRFRELAGSWWDYRREGAVPPAPPAPPPPETLLISGGRPAGEAARRRFAADAGRAARELELARGGAEKLRAFSSLLGAVDGLAGAWEPGGPSMPGGLEPAVRRLMAAASECAGCADEEEAGARLAELALPGLGELKGALAACGR